MNILLEILYVVVVAVYWSSMLYVTVTDKDVMVRLMAAGMLCIITAGVSVFYLV